MGNFDLKEYNTTVAAYTTIAAITAAASAGAVWLYYTVVAQGKYKKAINYIQTIQSICNKYANRRANNANLQKNYLNTAKGKLDNTSWGDWFSSVIVRYTAKQIDEALKSVKQQLVDSSRLYLRDIGSLVPQNDDAIINLAKTKVSNNQVVN